MSELIYRLANGKDIVVKRGTFEEVDNYVFNIKNKNELFKIFIKDILLHTSDIENGKFILFDGNHFIEPVFKEDLKQAAIAVCEREVMKESFRLNKSYYCLKDTLFSNHIIYLLNFRRYTNAVTKELKHWLKDGERVSLKVRLVKEAMRNVGYEVERPLKKEPEKNIPRKEYTLPVLEEEDFDTVIMGGVRYSPEEVVLFDLDTFPDDSDIIPDGRSR